MSNHIRNNDNAWNNHNNNINNDNDDDEKKNAQTKENTEMQE